MKVFFSKGLSNVVSVIGVIFVPEFCEAWGLQKASGTTREIHDKWTSFSDSGGHISLGK